MRATPDGGARHWQVGLGNSMPTVDDASAETSLIAVQGPAPKPSWLTCARGSARERHRLKYYAVAEADVDGIDVLLARTGYTGEDGFEIYVPERGRRRICGRVATGGHHCRRRLPAGLACRDTLRLEAGMPLYGHELTATPMPYQAGLGTRGPRSRRESGRDFVGKGRAAAAFRAVRMRSDPRGLKGSGRRAAGPATSVHHSADG